MTRQEQILKWIEEDATEFGLEMFYRKWNRAGRPELTGYYWNEEMGGRFLITTARLAVDFYVDKKDED